MKATGIVRKIDELGRIVIPKELRKTLDIKDEVDSMEIYIDGESIILKKYAPGCIFCGEFTENTAFGKRMCPKCIKKIKKIDTLLQ